MAKETLNEPAVRDLNNAHMAVLAHYLPAHV